MGNKPVVKIDDICKILKNVEDTVYKRSKDEQILPELVRLPLIVAEIHVLMLEKHWPFNEDIKEIMASVREDAKLQALKMMESYKESE